MSGVSGDNSTPASPRPSFGQWLAGRRKAEGYTQQELAVEVGYSAFTIAKIEEGTRWPSRKLAERLVDKLGAPEEERSRLLQLARQRRSDPLPDKAQEARAVSPTSNDEPGERGFTFRIVLFVLDDPHLAVVLVAVPPDARQSRTASALVHALEIST